MTVSWQVLPTPYLPSYEYLRNTHRAIAGTVGTCDLAVPLRVQPCMSLPVCVRGPLCASRQPCVGDEKWMGARAKPKRVPRLIQRKKPYPGAILVMLANEYR